MKRFRKKILGLFAVITMLLLSAELVHAATIAVDTTVDENPMVNNGRCSLREALHNANNDGTPPDEPDCAAGDGDDVIDLRGLSGTLDLLASLSALTTNLTILGPGASLLTIRAGGAYRIFDTASASLNLNISGLTLTNGAPSAGGGGAIFVEPTDTMNLTDCVITGNNLSTNQGGGIQNKGTLIIDRCLIADNHITAGTGEGGGIVSEGDLTVRNSAIVGNSLTNSNNGGGIKISNGSLNLVNSTVSGNSANGGGGLYITALSTPVTVKILSSTITDNHATAGEGGGLAMSAATASDISVTVQNSILAGNTAFIEGADCTDDNGLSGTVVSQGFNLLGIDDQCSGEFDGTGDKIGTLASPLNPRLSALADNGGPTPSHALQAGSPAIDGGNPSGCRDENGLLLGLDQRGFSRNGDGDANGSAVCDIGAFENACGDGRVTLGEDCDDGDANSDTQPNACRSSCQAAACGDGVVDAGEACDDGNLTSGDGCEATCALPSCGNAVVDPGEDCDDGNADDQDACSNTCLDNAAGATGGSGGGCRLGSKGTPAGPLAFGFGLLLLAALRLASRRGESGRE
ncbi:MAG: choice-of-anchor Q domain-containing protein [bacterium]